MGCAASVTPPPSQPQQPIPPHNNNGNEAHVAIPGTGVSHVSLVAASSNNASTTATTAAVAIEERPKDNSNGSNGIAAGGLPPPVLNASESKAVPGGDNETQMAEALARENAELKAEVARLTKRISDNEKACPKGAAVVEGARGLAAPAVGGAVGLPEDVVNQSLSIIVIGASGDLAWKKTFPALFSLYAQGLLPKHVVIAGYARSPMEEKAFHARISKSFAKQYANLKDEFLTRCFYHHGQYDSPADFKAFANELDARERKSFPEVARTAGIPYAAHRVFYMAIPPTLFVDVGKGIQPAAMTTTGWNRVIVEKPFGKDSESSAELGRQLSSLFTEQQIYRIDHYLGKEMVQNLMVLRFANEVFEPLWNRHHIRSVQITFKEDFGTQGRGGYFDGFGIIRDVMQNHLLQILSLIGMESPVSLSAEDVRDEKVKLLRAIQPIALEDIIIGQYGPDPKGTEGGYLDDKTVPAGSVTPTFAAAALHINNPRWKGVPFILKCGKALNERKAEIRIQFQKPVSDLFTDVSPNELVLRVQPDEAVYMKMTTKKPGLAGGHLHTELDLSYKLRHAEETKVMPDAYERLILDVVRGDHNLFVRADELEAAWKIFTPILHRLERERIRPTIYEFGSRGPAAADDLVSRYGYNRTTGYRWRAASAADTPAAAPPASVTAPAPTTTPAATK